MIFENAHHQKSFNQILVIISKNLHWKNLRNFDEIINWSFVFYIHEYSWIAVCKKWRKDFEQIKNSVSAKNRISSFRSHIHEIWHCVRRFKTVSIQCSFQQKVSYSSGTNSAVFLSHKKHLHPLQKQQNHQ